jgi:hypothetical protein
MSSEQALTNAKHGMSFPQVSESEAKALRRLGPVAFLAGAFLLTGVSCGGSASQPPLFPVTGQVFYQGKPAHKAIVWLHAENAHAKKDYPPRGVVQQDGSFQISTYKTNDGAPPGRYRVTISWRAPGKLSDEEGPELLPARYQDPLKSELPVLEVKEVPLELPPFRLTN